MTPRALQNTRGKILVVDDESGMRVALTDVLQRADWDVEAVESGEAALERLRSAESFDLMITDFRMGKMNGMELAKETRRIKPDLPIVMMTAYGSVEDAVAAMKSGVDDYLLKPFSFESVIEVVEQVTRGRRKRESAQPSPRTRKSRGSGSVEMIGESPAWKNVVRIAEEVADADATVLLSGESGTGKEVLARFIHERSGRTGSFVAINCAALPEGVLESELFGHEKGAFTGAMLSRKGRFELAHGGTILLDEISEIPLALQAKMLRVLQEREVHPIGGDAPVKLDFRVIATTNRNLEKYVEEGHFRQDLYYRLNVITLDLPSLRHHPEDILPLAEHFLKRFKRKDRKVEGFSAEVKHFLLNYRWRGNVREMENLVERASLLARGKYIEMGDLHIKEAFPDLSSRMGGILETEDSDQCEGSSASQTLEEMERRMILQTLNQFGGNRTRTAESLGVSVRTIRNKLNHYGIMAKPVSAG